MLMEKGALTSLGDYVVETTTIITEDGTGQQTVGMFDQQKERYIDGLTIGGKRFGRMSCPTNLYPHFEVGKEVELYTWLHPFLGWPPLRTGIIGVIYPNEKRAYVVSMGQMALSLLMLALLPILWVIPAIVVGGILDAILHPPQALTSLVVFVVAIGPWIAAGLMIFNYMRMKAAHPYATVPR
ncbi:MAG: hypothetical protein QM759_10600 [Terricaulis sp.]